MLPPLGRCTSASCAQVRATIRVWSTGRHAADTDPPRRRAADACCSCRPATTAVPLILLGHGAHLSKDDPMMQILAKTFCRGVRAAVALDGLPGPRRATLARAHRRRVRGRHRAADVRSREPRRGHRRLDRGRGGRTRDRTRALSGPTGYAGFSMGAMFGLAIVGELPSVTAARVRARRLAHQRAQRLDSRRCGPPRRSRSA